MISQRSKAKAPVSETNVGTGKATLRLRSQGPATIEALVRNHSFTRVFFTKYS